MFSGLGISYCRGIFVPLCHIYDKYVALTLMIAENRTEEKDVMVKVVVNLINQKNE